MKQLKLFDSKLISWLDTVSYDWLLNYLNRLFPELKFRLRDDYPSIEQTKYKNIKLNFHISTDASLDIWSNPVLIHLGVDKIKGGYEGMGVAVDNMKDFEFELQRFLVKFYEYKEADNG